MVTELHEAAFKQWLEELPDEVQDNLTPETTSALRRKFSAIQKGAKCWQCPLLLDPMAPSEIPQGAVKIAAVGEAPGFQEATYGRPFMGPSGQLLMRVLKHYSIERKDVMLSNVSLCRPPGNSTPPKAAIAACRNRLVGELRELSPDHIIALGGTAASELVDDTRTITSVRVGPPKRAVTSIQRSSDPDYPRVIPTWHPAYCLRTADAFPALVSDIGKIREKKREPWSPPQWRHYDDPDTALAVIAQLRTGTGPLVVDIEVGIEKDTAFGHPNTFDLLCVGIAYARRKAVVLGEAACQDREVLDALGELLRGRRLVAHNGKFDLAGLFPHVGALGLWYDTMLASYVLDERPGQHGLKMRAVEDLGAPQYDLEIFKYIPKGGNYANIPRPILYKYNAYDVACTWDLMEYQMPKLEQAAPEEVYGIPVKNRTMREVHDFLVSASNQLMYLELNGIAVDRSWQDELTMLFSSKLEQIELELDNVVKDSCEDFPHGLNPRSPKQVKEYLETQRVQVGSTNKEILETLHGRLSPESPAGRFVDTLLTHRRQQKLFSTYVTGIRKRLYRGRVYTTYLLHGTTSGRLSSRNPNLQNIVRDKDIKRQFSVSNPNNSFVHVDYSQAEGRVVCTLAQDEYLRQVFKSDEDLFDTLGKGLYGNKFRPGDKNQRVRVKAYFYGMAYGREAYSIAQEYKLPVAEAERGLAEFRALIPNVVKWQEDIRKTVLSGGNLVTPFGRRRRFYLITEQNQRDVLNEALSYLPQSTASDICLSAFIRLRPLLKGKAFIRLTIHDALVAECAEESKEEVGQIIAQEMTAAGSAFTDYVPFDVDVTYGKHWGAL
jgi:uracil-DNA glycosylase family 4